ncbi:MAG: xanthine dehydrogenase family protein subunit M [Chloroflexia bacterium]
MRNFDYLTAANPSEAATLLANSNARIVAGGTDLLPLMKDGLANPDLLVDISHWREGREISRNDGGLRIGALATLSEIANHPEVTAKYPALAEACNLSASPQLRNMGTIGGNLLQATRCWYFRGPYDCWLKGGDKCYARNGENELHSIFHTSPTESMCVSASPSDPATALLALDATVTYQTQSGSAAIPIAEFFRLPTPDKRTTISIPADAIITAITLPDAKNKSVYHTVMSRATWTFALAGVAISVQTDANLITEARVALGGVAPIPIRIKAVEEAMLGKSIASLPVDQLARMLVDGAKPLSNNGYKVTLLAGLFRETLAALK